MFKKLIYYNYKINKYNLISIMEAELLDSPLRLILLYLGNETLLLALSLIAGLVWGRNRVEMINTTDEVQKLIFLMANGVGVYAIVSLMVNITPLFGPVMTCMLLYSIIKNLRSDKSN